MPSPVSKAKGRSAGMDQLGGIVWVQMYWRTAQSAGRSKGGSWGNEPPSHSVG